MSSTEADEVRKGIDQPVFAALNRILSSSAPPGYSRYYKKLRDFLLAQFGNRIVVEGQEDPMISGNFEVTVEGGHLIHSKRHAGQGKATTDKEKQAIVEQIQELLD